MCPENFSWIIIFGIITNQLPSFSSSFFSPLAPSVDEAGSFPKENPPAAGVGRVAENAGVPDLRREGVTELPKIEPPKGLLEKQVNNREWIVRIRALVLYFQNSYFQGEIYIY